MRDEMMRDGIDRVRRRDDVDRGADAAERVIMQRGVDTYALCSMQPKEWLESSHYAELEAWR